MILGAFETARGEARRTAFQTGTRRELITKLFFGRRGHQSGQSSNNSEVLYLLRCTVLDDIVHCFAETRKMSHSGMRQVRQDPAAKGPGGEGAQLQLRCQLKMSEMAPPGPNNNIKALWVY